MFRSTHTEREREEQTQHQQQMDRVINSRSRETRKTISTSSPVSDMFRKLSECLPAARLPP